MKDYNKFYIFSILILSFLTCFNIILSIHIIDLVISQKKDISNCSYDYHLNEFLNSEINSYKK